MGVGRRPLPRVTCGIGARCSLPYWLFNFEEICEVLIQAGAKPRPRGAEPALFSEYIANARAAVFSVRRAEGTRYNHGGHAVALPP
jgi:hypothetical protein